MEDRCCEAACGLATSGCPEKKERLLAQHPVCSASRKPMTVAVRHMLWVQPAVWRPTAECFPGRCIALPLKYSEDITSPWCLASSTTMYTKSWQLKLRAAQAEPTVIWSLHLPLWESHSGSNQIPTNWRWSPLTKQNSRAGPGPLCRPLRSRFVLWPVREGVWSTQQLLRLKPWEEMGWREKWGREDSSENQ